jgi:hypothetical protein
MIEQRCVIKFFAEEGHTMSAIHRHLIENYGRRAMSRSEVYRSIKDIKGGRTDSKTIPSLERTPHEGLADVNRRTIEQDPHL